MDVTSCHCCRVECSVQNMNFCSITAMPFWMLWGGTLLTVSLNKHTPHTHTHTVHLFFVLACLLSPGTSIWKAFFFTPDFYPENSTTCFHTHACFCTEAYVTRHDPPLLYDLSKDPSETNPLTPDTEPNFSSVLEVILEAERVHTLGVKATEEQLSAKHMVWKPWLQPCCSSLHQLCMCQRDWQSGIVVNAGEGQEEKEKWVSRCVMTPSLPFGAILPFVEFTQRERGCNEEQSIYTLLIKSLSNFFLLNLLSWPDFNFFFQLPTNYSTGFSKWKTHQSLHS